MSDSKTVYERNSKHGTVKVHNVEGRVMGKAKIAGETFTTGLLDTIEQVLKSLSFRAKYKMSDEAATKARSRMRRDE
jgi:hypothetical protein